MKYIFIVLLCGLLSCKGTKEAKTSTSSSLAAETTTVAANKTGKQVGDYKKIATEKIGEGVQYEMNKSQTLVLCKKVTVSKNIPMSPAGGKGMTGGMAGSGNVKLIVINVEQNDVIFEKNIAYGSATWASDTQLKIVEVMGANMPNNPNAYLYDVISKKKTAITSENTNDSLIKKP